MKLPGVYRMMSVIWLAVAPGIPAADTASTNKEPGSLAGLRSLTMDELLQTSAADTYGLSPALTGKCTVVFASGIFKEPEPALFATNRYKLKFDVAVVTPKRTVAHVGPHGIARFEKDGGYTVLHTHRDTLPADAEIQSAGRRAGLEKLLGPSQDLFGAPRRSWRYFSMNRDGGVDTLQVVALLARDDRVESLEILRGTAQPEIKRPKKN